MWKCDILREKSLKMELLGGRNALKTSFWGKMSVKMAFLGKSPAEMALFGGGGRSQNGVFGGKAV